MTTPREWAYTGPTPWMRWYYQELGGHTHVRVFMNGGKCGDLVFRNEEFQRIREWAAFDHMVECLPDTLPQEGQAGEVKPSPGA